MTFTEWMAKVNETVDDKAGISVYDLTDYAFRDAYDSGEDPEDVAIDVRTLYFQFQAVHAESRKATPDDTE